MHQLYTLWQSYPQITLPQLFYFIKQKQISTDGIMFEGLIDIDIQSSEIIDMFLINNQLIISLNAYKLKHFIPILSWIENQYEVLSHLKGEESDRKSKKDNKMQEIAYSASIINQYIKHYLLLKYDWLPRHLKNLEINSPKINSLTTLQPYAYGKVDFDQWLGMCVTPLDTAYQYHKLQLSPKIPPFSPYKHLRLGGEKIKPIMKLSVRSTQRKIEEEHHNENICFSYFKTNAYLIDQPLGKSI